jgi:autotransporter-associated beta strand protein
MKPNHSFSHWGALSWITLTFSATFLSAAPPEPAGQLTIERTIAGGLTIPDEGEDVKTFTWQNSGLSTLSGVVIKVNLSSPDLTNPMWLGDLFATLTHGTAIEQERMGVLFNRPGVTAEDDFGDSASSLSQSYDLSAALAGSWLASDRWSLFLEDSGQGGVARLDNLTLTLTGTAATTSSMVLLGGDIISGSSQVTIPVTLSNGPSSQIVTANIGAQDTIHFSGGFNGSANLLKQGDGKLSIEAESGTYTGEIELSAGILELKGNNPLGSDASIKLSAGGTQLSLLDGTTLDSSVILGSSGNLPSISVSGWGESASISSNITGVGGFDKTGAGNLILGGDNTYTGPTNISEGSVTLDGSIGSSEITVSDDAALVMGKNSSASGEVLILEGGLLAGEGSFDSAVNISGIHLVGGLQTFNNGLSYGPNGSKIWQLSTHTEDTAARGISYTGVNLTNGNLDITPGTLVNLSFTKSLQGGDPSDVSWSNSFWDLDRSWLLISNPGTTTGNFAVGLVGNDSLGRDLFDVRQGSAFTIIQQNGDIYLNYAASAIPEPNLISLISGLAGVILLRRRR